MYHCVAGPLIDFAGPNNNRSSVIKSWERAAVVFWPAGVESEDSESEVEDEDEEPIDLVSDEDNRPAKRSRELKEPAARGRGRGRPAKRGGAKKSR